MLNFFGLFLFINECDLSQGLDSGGFRGGARALILESNCGWKGQELNFLGRQAPLLSKCLVDRPPPPPPNPFMVSSHAAI